MTTTNFNPSIKPQHVFHRIGGRVVEVVGIKRQGYDSWFVGRVAWDDGSGDPMSLHPIDAAALCTDTPEGQAEITVLLERLRTHTEVRAAFGRCAPRV